MKKADEQFISEVRERLKKLTKGSGKAKNTISQNGVGRATGLSPTTINHFIHDKYEGDILSIAKNIDSWMNRLAEKKKTTEVFKDTIETFAVKKVMHACRIAHVENKMVVITGDAGVGKTRGANKYVEATPKVIHVQVVPFYTAKDVMIDIHRALDFSGKGTLGEMFRDVQEQLKDSGRLLLIDEAELLPYRGLEMVRRLHDLTGIGMVLVGMPRLIDNMRGQKGQYKQLYSRITIHASIPSLELTEKDDRIPDIQLLVNSVFPNSNGLWKKFYKHTNNPRTLRNLIDQSIKLAQINGVEIDAAVIEKAKNSIIL